MVYCTKCGAKNEDTAEVCAQCGASLGTRPGRKKEECFGTRRAEEECFGLPHGGAIVGIIIGVIIILVGASWLTGIEWEGFWPMIVIIFGILVIAGAIYGLSRRP